MEREEIKFVQARYHQLNLTPEQAAVALRYEGMRESRSETHFFSAWEEWDFEYSIFSKVLTEDQMVEYQKRVAEQKEWHIENLVNQDNANKMSADQRREKTDYLKNELIPSIHADFRLFAVMSFGQDRSKIEYLRANYRTFLHDRRKQILIDHFRHNRTYAPIQLKSALLGHYESCLLPDFASFKSWMDEPTRAVAEFLQSKLPRKTSDVAEFHLGKLNESKAFAEQVNQKYYRHIDGWNVWTRDPLPEEEENNNWLMSMLLLDGSAYGFEDID